MIRNILLFTLLVLGGSSLYAQNKLLNFEGEPLVQILNELARETDFRFNFDPQLLEDYSYQGKLDLASFPNNIGQLFVDTPLSFAISGKTILIYLSDQQVYKICGYVYDAEESFPLIYVNVFAPGINKGAESNEQGYFEFEVAAFKNQKIQISYVGYKNLELKVTAFENQGCPKFMLENSNDLFSTIIVSEYIFDGISEGEENSAVNLSYELLSNWYTNIEQDVFKTIQLIPGISSIDESASNIQIRGGSADQNGIFWEGANLYGPGHVFGMISSINPFTVQNIKVFKGVFDPAYSNRVGGIVDISLNDSIPKNIGGSLGTTLTEVHAKLELPIIKEKASLLLAGRNTINTIFQSPTLLNYKAKVFQSTKVDETEESNMQELDYNDFNAKLLLNPGPNLFAKASFFLSNNKFNFSIPILDDRFATNDDVNFSTQAYNFFLQKNWQNGLTTKVSYNYSNYMNAYNFEFIELPQQNQLEDRTTDNNIFDRSLLLSANYKLKDSEFNLGYEWEQNEVNYNVINRNIYEENWEEFNNILGNFHNVFLAYEYTQPNFQLNAGLRNTYYAQAGQWYLSPRLNIQYALNDDLKFKFSTGILHQFLTQVKDFGENELGLENQIWVLNSDEEIALSQKAQKVAAGFLFHKKGWLIDAEVYYNNTEGISTFSRLLPNLDEEDGFSLGNAAAYGLDLLIKKRWGFYSSWLNYSLGRVNFFFEEFRTDPFLSNSDQTHNLAFINNFKWKNWNLGLSYQWRTGLPFTANDGFKRVEEDDDEYFVINYPDINNARLPDYQRLDIGLTYKYRIPQSSGQLEFALSFLNLLDRDNPFNKSFFLDENDEVEEEFEIVEVDKFLLPRTMLLLMRYSW